ncbi:hypothetical protein ACRAWG_24430 [Methylobacterium sp. P31]
MDSPDDISADALLAQLATEGIAVTRDQLSRWQREDLIPRPIQRGLGRGAGSETRYPLHACAQVRRVAELMEQYGRVDRVGWQLWWEGFDIHERHWRPALASAAKWLRKLSHIAARWQRLDEARDVDRTGYERIAESSEAAAPFNIMWHRSPIEGRARFIRLIGQICAGEVHVAQHHEQLENDADVSAFVKLSALNQHKSDTILGIRFAFAEEIPAILHTLAISMKDIARSEPNDIGMNADLEMARDYMRESIAMVMNLYEATEWIYGRSAFGLKMLMRVFNNAPPTGGAVALLVWRQYAKRAGADIISSEAIGQLKAQTEIALSDARRLQAMAAEPALAPLINKRRLVQAFKSEAEFAGFLDQLRAARAAQ